MRTFWLAMGICCEKSQNSSTPNRWKFLIELWRAHHCFLSNGSLPKQQTPRSHSHYNEEGMKVHVRTPEHFLIGRLTEAIPDHDLSYRLISTLRRWYWCETLLRHFWKRWQSEYLASLRKYSKRHKLVNNLEVGDIVVLREDNTMPILNGLSHESLKLITVKTD